MDPSHYRNFAITPVDLVFFFDRGEMMAGAAGAYTVYVPRPRFRRWRCSAHFRRHLRSTIEIGRYPKWLAVVMRDLQRRILRLIVTGSAAASFLIAAPALSPTDTEQVAHRVRASTA